MPATTTKFACFAVFCVNALAQLPPCGVIDRSTTLSHDCAGPMTVAKDGIDINLAFHKVICPLSVEGLRTGPGVAITNRQNVTLRNGVIGGLCSLGVAIEGGGNHRLTQLEVSGNYDSLWVSGSSANRITQSVFANNYRGPQFDGSSRNTLTSIVVRDNEKTGFLFEAGSNDNIIDMATIARNGSKVRGPEGLIFSEDAVRNLLLRSTVKENYYGAWIGTSSVVEDTVVKQSARVGLYLSGVLNLVIDNGVNGNGFAYGASADGLATAGDPDMALPDATMNVLSGNLASSNGRYDLADYANGLCTANYWWNNKGAKTLDGCEAAQQPPVRALAAAAGRLTTGEGFSFVAILDGAAGVSGTGRFENLRNSAGAVVPGAVEGSVSCLTVVGDRAVAAFTVSIDATYHVFAIDAGKASAGFPDRIRISKANEFPAAVCNVPDSWTTTTKIDRGEFIVYGRTR